MKNEDDEFWMLVTLAVLLSCVLPIAMEMVL